MLQARLLLYDELVVQLMTTPQEPEDGKTDPVDVRAAEIAKREGRETISDADRKRAFEEMQKMAPPPEKK